MKLPGRNTVMSTSMPFVGARAKRQAQLINDNYFCRSTTIISAGPDPAI